MILNLWRADAAPLQSPAPASARRSWFYRHLFLWVLQAWLAMFYIGAAVAKLSQPPATLSYLLEWPARVDPALVVAAGWGELTLAIAVLTPLATWRIFRPVLLVGAAGLLADALLMGAYHGVERHWSLAAVNLLLAATAFTVLIGRRPAAEPTGRRA